MFIYKFLVFIECTAQLPKMTSAEKVILIQEQMRTIQKKWTELKSEVTTLDRKKRKAKKKEREGEIRYPVQSIVYVPHLKF